MYQAKLLDAYKKAFNYIQDKQIAADLGISYQKISKIRSGERYLTEKEAIFLAERINLEAEAVLVYLAVDKSKTTQAKQAWENIIKKWNYQGLQLHSIGLVALVTASNADIKEILQCALCKVW